MIPDLPVDQVARSLLGAHVRTELDGTPTEVMLTEVEAYDAEDPASHAFRGPRHSNQSMFQESGTLYVYRSYGVHWCANVVTGPAGRGEAVLLRAGTPIAGEALMRSRRGREDHLCDGPGKLCQALGITGDLDGTSLSTGPARLTLADEIPGKVIATPRIGITKATERLWRFVLVQ
ncbi:MAG: DNA-3-methyladenine glycosylase [Acidimicrobiia bacterium]